IIVQASRMRDGSRKITHVTEVIGLEGEIVTLQDLFVYDLVGEDASGRIVGRHRSTGIARPYFYEKARYFGEDKRLTECLASAEVNDEHGRPLGEKFATA
ncbi:MAG: CpaF family protein, partial [Methyloceanibacter sp.]|nr:CpaF family protein [Methyloceanibacter sp.]